MNTKVTISVIIPVYNCQQYLRQCIDSVLGQTLQDIEIFCIDDGSTDESLDVLQEYEETYSSVHVFQQPNSGAGAARNLGLQHAKGEYIAFLDADDYYLDADALQKMYCMCKQNNVKVCGSFGKVLEEIFLI